MSHSYSNNNNRGRQNGQNRQPHQNQQNQQSEHTGHNSYTKFSNFNNYGEYNKLKKYHRNQKNAGANTESKHHLELPRLFSNNEGLGQDVLSNSDVIAIIPKGKRCVFWFTTYLDQNVCYIIDALYVPKFNPLHNRVVHCCFHTSLCYGNGTIMRGTYSHIGGTLMGTVEDIYYYKGKHIQNEPLINRLNLLHSVFEHDITQIKYFNRQMVLSVCVMMGGDTDNQTVLNIANGLPYPVKFVQYKFSNRKSFNVSNVDIEVMANKIAFSKSTVSQRRNFILKNFQGQVPNAVFCIKPDLQMDIYHLYTLNEYGELNYHGNPGIQSFEASVFMNGIFRNIKENRNLDLLEESDDEEEFENINSDKYVYLDREVNIVCKYNIKLDKWLPLRVAHKKQQVARPQDVFDLGKKT